MNQASRNEPDDLWHHLVESFLAYSRASAEFFAEGTDRVALLRKGLGLPRGENRATALDLLKRMNASEQMQLFPELIRLARAAHGPVETIREIILGLPRDWVLASIEQQVNPLLNDEEYDDYWMFLELYEQLDRNLTLNLARRAVANPDPEIRELGEDQLERLREPQLQAEHS
jgi:hypothetical protein